VAKYVYVGWGPEIDPEGQIVRPFDEREFAEQPTWGRWAQAGDTPPETIPVPVLSADELGALKKTADAELAAAPSLTAPPVKGF
jgi:hypothetical protein